MKLLLYCIKAKPYLADFKGEYQTFSNGKELDELWDKGFNPNDIMNIFNGKIVAECDFEVEKIELLGDEINLYYGIENRACLTTEQIENYLGYDNDYKGYAIHIKNLHIFDKPNELFYYDGKTKEGVFYHLNKAPQNMMYAYDIDEIKYILISIRPEWLCKILNGEKTIEVRKKVLKEML